MDADTFRLWARLVHRKSDELYEDAMIAATAIRNDSPWLPRNVRDFAIPRRQDCSIRLRIQSSLTLSPHIISGFSPSAVRSITSRSAKDELILVTCGIADSHCLWMRS